MMRSTCALTGLVFLAGCSGGGAGDSPPSPKPKDARILSFSVEPRMIELGQEVTLRWQTSGAQGVDVEPRVGLQAPSGSARDRPLATTTYTLIIPGAPPDLRAQTSVVVGGGLPVIDELRATPRTIARGEMSTLEWKTTHAERVTIDPDLGVQPPIGNAKVMPEVTTTYRLVASNGALASPPQEVVVVVASGTQPIVRTFNATPQSVAPGDQVTLSWQALNATGVTIDNGVGQKPSSGSVTVNPRRTTIFNLTATGPGGQAVASVTVNVTQDGPASISRFDAMPPTIVAGGQAELTWDTDNALSVTIDNGVGARAPKDSIIVRPAQTTSYTLTALGSSGSSATRAVTVTVAAPDQPVVLTFGGLPSNILEGGTATLRWTTANVTAVDIDHDGGTGLPPNGSVQVTPAQTTSYTLIARGPGGSVTSVFTITVSRAPPSISAFAAQPASITAGAASTLSWTTSNATQVSIDNGVGAQAVGGSARVTPAQNTTYTLAAVGPGGTATAQATVSVTSPGAPVVASFTATPQQVVTGGQSTLAWSVTNATQVTIDNGLGTVAAAGTRSVSPGMTTTYALSATGPGGTTSARVTVDVRSILGDRCEDPFIVTGSGTFMGNTLQANNDYEEAQMCTGFRQTGPDQVYRISLQAGDRVQATLTPSPVSYDAALYLVTSCANIAQSCVAGSNSANPQRIDYTSASAGSYYLIVDGYGGAGGAYRLDITFNPAPVPNDRCSGAIDVGRGGRLTGDTTFAHNDYDPGSGGCTIYPEVGHDVTYRVTLAAGERLQATLDAPWDRALYAVTDCAMVARTCVAGSNSGNPEHIDFTSAGGGTYYLIVDGYGNNAGAFILDVTTSPAARGGETCESAVVVPVAGGSFRSTTAGLMHRYNPPLSCTGFREQGADRAYRLHSQEGDVVEVQSAFDAGLDGALYVVRDCNNIMSCIAGADRNPAGQPEDLRYVARGAADHYIIVTSYAPGSSGGHDLAVRPYSGATCQSAAPLNITNVPEFFSTRGHANTYSPSSNGCTGYSEAGPDRAYSVRLNAGDQLNVLLHPDGYDAALYAVSNCADVNGSCFAGSDRVISGDESIAPVVQQSGTYYVIADAFSAGGTGALTAHISHGDVCPDAYTVPPGRTVFRGTTSGYAPDYGIATAAQSCTGYAQLGRDAAYRVTLANGQRIDASLDSIWDSALYLIGDCARSANTCLAGSDSGNPEHISYVNRSGSTQTYYLIVDSWRMSEPGVDREGPYTLTLTLN